MMRDHIYILAFTPQIAKKFLGNKFPQLHGDVRTTLLVGHIFEDFWKTESKLYQTCKRNQSRGSFMLE